MRFYILVYATGQNVYYTEWKWRRNKLLINYEQKYTNNKFVLLLFLKFIVFNLYFSFYDRIGVLILIHLCVEKEEEAAEESAVTKWLEVICSVVVHEWKLGF